jgi:tetratricopeptide (TPR) repeat protein
VQEAELSFLRSMRLRLGSPGEEGALAESLDHLASLYYQMERPEDGLAVHEQALRLRRQVFGDDSVEVADSLILVASAHELRGDLAKAEDLFRRSIEILRAKANSTEDREKLGTALINLGTLLKKAGRKDEGEATIQEGLRVTDDADPAR